MILATASKKVSNVRFCRVVGLSIMLIAANSAAQTNPDSAPEPPKVSGKVAQVDQAPTKEQCVESHRLAQQAQNEEKLVRARELARTCTALACPGLVISDCARWLNDIEQRVPSVVFEVRLDGKPNLTARILADGKVVEEWTRGEALRLDPGEHQFRFELGDRAPVTQTVLLAEGMRYRIVSAEFKTDTPAATGTASPLAPQATTAAPASAPTAAVRPVPVVVYPLLGVGAAGVGSFALFGLLGKSKQSDLESSCKPNCTQSDLKPMKTSYLIGDISLGVGIASFAAASILYFGRPERQPTTIVGITPVPGGAAALATHQF